MAEELGSVMILTLKLILIARGNRLVHTKQGVVESSNS